MWEKEKIWIEFDALPPGAQYAVFEFIEFLRARYQDERVIRTSQETPLLEESFIGMWKDREDMQDSSAYVRKLRQCEWGIKHG